MAFIFSPFFVWSGREIREIRRSETTFTGVWRQIPFSPLWKSEEKVSEHADPSTYQSSLIRCKRLNINVRAFRISFPIKM
jgi:hypothetical protein